MKAVIFCFVALFARALAAPKIPKDFDINSTYRIVNGNETTIEAYPYQVSLRLKGKHDCGGSVLTTTRALTAAHCLRKDAPPSQYSIKAGSTYSLDQGDPKAQIRTLARFIMHPSYDRINVRYDIAILNWIEPLVFGANVQPIVLPRSNYALPYGRLAITSGWGIMHVNGSSVLPQRLQAVATTLLNNTVCNLAYRGRVKTEMVCTGSEGGRSACDADSGGPLVDKSRNSFVQIGVVSFGICGIGNVPTVYSGVQYFTGWIRANSY